MKTFIVQSKDLFDEKKNPGLVLSPKKILENKKIPKRIFKGKSKTSRKQKEIKKICNGYAVMVMQVIKNKQGLYDVLLDHNIYYKIQEEMEKEIRKLGLIGEIDYSDIW